LRHRASIVKEPAQPEEGEERRAGRGRSRPSVRLSPRRRLLPPV